MNGFKLQLPTAAEYRTARRAFRHLRRIAAYRAAGKAMGWL